VQQSDNRSLGNKLAHDLQTLLSWKRDHQRGARGVAARPAVAGDKTTRHRIDTHDEDDGNRRGRGLRRQRGRRRLCKDHVRRMTDEIGRKSRKPVILPFRPTIFDRNVAARGKTVLAEAAREKRKMLRCGAFRDGAEPANHRNRLLRARRSRPQACRTAQ